LGKRRYLSALHSHQGSYRLLFLQALAVKRKTNTFVTSSNHRHWCSYELLLRLKPANPMSPIEISNIIADSGVEVEKGRSFV
jgi:hypothetical protein